MSKTKIYNLLLGAALFFACQTLTTAAVRHTFHTSLARMDYNEREKTLEISIQLFTHDLVPTIQKRAGKSIDLEKTPNIDELILDYLNQNLVLRDKTGDTRKLVWVGKEVEVDTTYVYVQFPLESGADDLSLQNTLFFESFAEQTNLVVVRNGGKKSDLLFVAGDKFKSVILE